MTTNNPGGRRTLKMYCSRTSAPCRFSGASLQQSDPHCRKRIQYLRVSGHKWFMRFKMLRVWEKYADAQVIRQFITDFAKSSGWKIVPLGNGLHDKWTSFTWYNLGFCLCSFFQLIYECKKEELRAAEVCGDLHSWERWHFWFSTQLHIQWYFGPRGTIHV